MSTRVLPVCGFPCFNRMSELRRRFQAPAVPEQSNQEPSAEQTRSVRRNLFGPIDHEENIKFVQEELSKIAQADYRRWNFDFQKEKPLEGRYAWEAAQQGKIPEAYNMTNLTAKITRPDEGPSSSKLTTVTAPSSSGPDVAAIELSLKSVSSATTTVLSATKPRTSSVENIITPVSFVQSVPKSSTIIRPSSMKQKQMTDFMKHVKRTHSSTEDKTTTDAHPQSSKRARTSS